MNIIAQFDLYDNGAVVPHSRDVDVYAPLEEADALKALHIALDGDPHRDHSVKRTQTERIRIAGEVLAWAFMIAAVILMALVVFAAGRVML